MLLPEQIAHFEAFGFLVVRQLFSPDEVEVIVREFEGAMMEARNGGPFDGQRHESVTKWFVGRPAVEPLMYDDRIHGPVEQLLGSGYSFLQWAENNANLYVGDTEWRPDQGWHPDIPGGRNDPNRSDEQWRYRYVPTVKAAFYLDPVGEDTGCLRVVTGSHKSPFHEQLWSLHVDIPTSAAKAESVRSRLLEMWERSTGTPEGGSSYFQTPA